MKEGDEGSEGAPASDADGRSPREPGMILDSSERLKMITISAGHKKRDFAIAMGALTCPRIDFPSAPRH